MSGRRISALLFVTSMLAVPFVRAQSPSRAAAQSQGVEPGSIENSVFRNSRFGFQFKIPYGWVDRTEQMRDTSAGPGEFILLLAVFERPPEAKGETVNSAVVITAESTSAYPGLKSAADYFGPLSDVAIGKGFTVTSEPYYFSVGTKKVVRSDFSKKIGDVTMYQSSIVVLVKGDFVSFTFVGGSEDEVNELLDNLRFAVAVKRRE